MGAAPRWRRTTATSSCKRRANLKDLGYVSDRKTGNFVARLDPSEWPNDKLAGFMVATLAGGYDVALADIMTEAGSYPAVACPPRNPTGRDFGGEIAFNDRSQKDLEENCEVAGMDDEDESHLPKPLKSIPMNLDDAGTQLRQSAKDLADTFKWLAEATGPGLRFAIFSWGEFYIQCMKRGDPVILCEVESADANPSLRRIVTTAVGRKLESMGFRPPGYSKNYIGSIGIKEGKAEDWSSVVMKAALIAFGGYAIQRPVTVERHVIKGETLSGYCQGRFDQGHGSPPPASPAGGPPPHARPPPGGRPPAPQPCPGPWPRHGRR
ncbi:hypothetical protein FBZ87_105168 [Nitrospirillum amazonense]|uniref:Uncharacterized protein n=1 Tax=Nitrospirillum amazonense TaxID=28077 RepID=A0A560JQ30_9PROT|nr:hypothetical protein FBZ87_105168 [Nitrospirillum amazonense]